MLLFLAVAAYAQPPTVTAKSWLVADETGVIIHSENAHEVRSIASITKLMTVMVVLDANQPLDEKISGRSRKEWIMMALIKSSNQAAYTLCNHYPTGNHACIEAMNTKAMSLGMTNTRFIEPTGLSIMNVSTAEELMYLVQAASLYPQIVEASRAPQLRVKTGKKWTVLQNTNPIIGKRYNFIVSKTGWIIASGGCIALLVENDLGRRIVILLGSRNTHTRIPEAELISKLN